MAALLQLDVSRSNVDMAAICGRRVGGSMGGVLFGPYWVAVVLYVASLVQAANRPGSDVSACLSLAKCQYRVCVLFIAIWHSLP